MTGSLRNLGRALAVALVALLPLEASAGMRFRNDLQIPVVVQGESVVGGMVRRGLPLLIRPGQAAQDAQVPLGARRITVYDASRPGNVILHRETVQYTGQTLRYLIRQGPTGGIQLAPADPPPGQ